MAPKCRPGPSSRNHAKNSLWMAKKSPWRAKNSLPDAKNSLPDAKNSLRDAKNSLPDAKNSLCDAKNSLPDAKNSPWDAKNSPWEAPGPVGTPAVDGAHEIPLAEARHARRRAVIRRARRCFAVGHGEKRFDVDVFSRRGRRAAVRPDQSRSTRDVRTGGHADPHARRCAAQSSARWARQAHAGRCESTPGSPPGTPSCRTPSVPLRHATSAGRHGRSSTGRAPGSRRVGRRGGGNGRRPHRPGGCGLGRETGE